MIDQELLTIVNRCFNYEYGKLYWKEQTTEKARVTIGSEVGSVNTGGYRVVKLMYKNYLVHRLIFLLHNNYLPKYIDHIDGNIGNNLIENLRECSHTENLQNKKLHRNNTSGLKNVSKNHGCNTWKVEIQLNGSKLYFGSYKTIEEANTVAIAKRKDLFGGFARDF